MLLKIMKKQILKWNYDKKKVIKVHFINFTGKFEEYASSYRGGVTIDQ